MNIHNSGPFDIRSIAAVSIECSEHHGIIVPVAQSTTETGIRKFLDEHGHLTTSPAGMREDFQKLHGLLSRLCTTDLMQIIDIAERRGLTIKFETKPLDISH